uniref:Uncharacterized protein n=1 Tax=Fagus sylvatica TaxID=28930 RepID=A0A2N9HA12_FAGSY
MRHIVGKLSTSSFQRYKVCANRSSDEGVMAPGSRGVGAVFVHFSDAKIPVKRGMLSANREFHDVAGVIIFPTHPGSRINLLRAGKTLRAKAAVREKKCVLLPARFFSNLVPVPDSRESELGLVRYGPASRVHRGVFGPFEGSFPIRIPADPDKFLAIREFHVVHGCVLFPMCPGSQINLLRVRKTLCASVATPCTEASLGSQDMILRTEAVGMFLMPKGGGQFDPVFGLVNGPVKPWSNLVNLGQTWSNLVKALQTLGNVSRTYISRVSGHGGSLVGLETARSNLGQTLVNPSQTWSTLVKLGQTLGNVSRTFFLGVFRGDEPSSEQTGLGSGCLVLRADTRENPGGLRSTISFRLYVPTGTALFRLGTRVSPAMQKNFNLPWKFFQMVGENWGLKLVKPPLSGQTWFGNSSKRSGKNWDLTLVDTGGKSLKPKTGIELTAPLTILKNPIWEATFAQEILSDPLQLGPRAKTLRQEVHFSYHMQLSDHQELLRSSRNLSQKMTPWHKERSNGLRSQDHILRTQARLCARPVPLENRVFLTRNKLIHKPGCVGKKTHSCTTWNSRIAKILSGQAGILIGKLPSNGPKTLRWPLFAEPYLTSPSSDFRKSGTLQKFEKKRAGRKTRFSSRTAAFARRVFPARNKLIYEPGCVGKITTPATSWNSRFAESIPHLIGIFTGKVHENSSNAPTSGSHNSLIRTPIHANFIPLERGRRELSGRYAA